MYPEYLRKALNNEQTYLGLPLLKEPEYGARQPEVTRAAMEAWQRLVTDGYVIEDSFRKGWYGLTRAGEALIRRHEMFERFERLGLDRVKDDLLKGELFSVGGTREQQEGAWTWVRMKENLAISPAATNFIEKDLPTAERRTNEPVRLADQPITATPPASITQRTNQSGRIRRVDCRLQQLKLRIRKLRSERLTYQEISERLADSPRPPRAGWRDFSWPIAYMRHTSAVTKWLSEVCS